MTGSYIDLRVWHQAMDLANNVYQGMTSFQNLSSTAW